MLLLGQKTKKNYKNQKFTDACLSDVSCTDNDFKLYGALIKKTTSTRRAFKRLSYTINKRLMQLQGHYEKSSFIINI